MVALKRLLPLGSFGLTLLAAAILTSCGRSTAPFPAGGRVERPINALDVAVADAQHVYIALAGLSGVYALHSTDGSGLTYGDLVEIDPAASVAVRNLSMAILAGGKPCVAYYDEDTGALMFGRLVN